MRAATASTETAYVSSEAADALNATDSPRSEAHTKCHPPSDVRDTIGPTLMNSPRTGSETTLTMLTRTSYHSVACYRRSAAGIARRSRKNPTHSSSSPVTGHALGIRLSKSISCDLPTVRSGSAIVKRKDRRMTPSVAVLNPVIERFDVRNRLDLKRGMSNARLQLHSWPKPTLLGPEESQSSLPRTSARPLATPARATICSVIRTRGP